MQQLQAPRFNALLLCLEHRHYGGYDFDAVPKFDLEGLHFLSSRQALEDVAAFRVYAAEVLDLQTATWVTFGGSYSGALSAWARLLYPDLFHAAVSSSAPMESQLNFRGYHDVVASSLASPHVGGTPQCLATITKGHAQLRELLRTTLGRRSLEKKFNLCGHRPLDDSNNVAGWAGMGVITSNQYNNNRCSITSCNIRLLCGNLSLMSEALPSELDALVELDRFQQEEAVATGAVQSVEKCKDISWNGYLESLQIQEKRTDGSNLMGLWTYQICTE